MKRIVYIIGCVVLLLTGCIGRGERMRSDLMMLEEANRNDSIMRNDSLAEALVEYFDNHGTPNERMRAYYILGRTYFDIGELPRALETYYLAAESADTTAADCDFKTLSRVHAQAALIFQRQIQPRSQLKELDKAEVCAWEGMDTLMAVECYAKKAFAYAYLYQPDSVIFIKENAARMFTDLGRNDRAAQTLGSTITALVKRNETIKAKRYIDIYESESGYFDKDGNIKKGHQIFLYIKGVYYLAVHQVDSAEFLFRKLINEGEKLNDLIAGNKGLQMVYLKKENPDSIAKYANLSYELNDSAYSLSEMENIQKFQASYNYNYNKLLAEQQMRKANRAVNWIVLIVSLMVIVSLISIYVFMLYRKGKQIQLLQYQRDLDQLERAQTELMELHSEEKQISEDIIAKKNAEIASLQLRITDYQEKRQHQIATLEERLSGSDIVKHLRALADANPYQQAERSDFRRLRDLINQEIPHFYTTVNTSSYTLSAVEYDVTLLLRVHFSPVEIHKLTGLSNSYISNMRSRLLQKVYAEEGSPKDYDQKVLSIR